MYEERPELDPILAREDGRPCSPWLLCGCSADLGCNCKMDLETLRAAIAAQPPGMGDEGDYVWTLSEEVAMLAGIRRKERL